MKELFMDTSILKEYTPHSCRSGVTSKGSHFHVNIAEILKQGCWENVKTFLKFLQKRHSILYTRRCRLYEYFNCI